MRGRERGGAEMADSLGAEAEIEEVEVGWLGGGGGQTSPILEARLRNCRGRGRPKLNFSPLRILISMSLIWAVVYARSVTKAKSAISGGYISSYLEATNMAVTPTSWSCFLGTGFSCRVKTS